MLKKASVLMFYGRYNDAFDQIAQAAKIIKDQNEKVKENEMDLQKFWQEKLGMNDIPEVPINKLTKDDLTDKFLRSLDSGSSDIATLKLYLTRVCP